MSQNDFNQEEDEKFFTEFKEKMAIDPLSDTVRRLEKQAYKRQIFTILILVIMATAAGICWNMYSSYIATKEPAKELVFLQADISPDKVRPENPGGMLVPNQDKTVYNRISADKNHDENVVISQPLMSEGYLNGKGTITEESEHGAKGEQDKTVIYSPSQKPAESEQENEEIKEPVEQTTYKSLFSEIAKQNTEIKNDTEKAAENVQKDVAEAANEVKNEVKTEVKEVKEAVKTQKTEAVKTAEKQKEVIKPVLKVEKPKSTSGNWRVQLLSSGDKAAVSSSWEKIKRKHASILNGYESEIVPATVSGKTIYRLRVKSFETRNDAAGVCQKLKAAKQDCVAIQK